MDYRQHLTAAVKDVVLATGISIHDTNRHRIAVARATRALTSLFEASAEHGMVDDVIAGFFKLSAAEPHRLPKMTNSIVALRLPAVARALVNYNNEH